LKKLIVVRLHDDIGTVDISDEYWWIDSLSETESNVKKKEEIFKHSINYDSCQTAHNYIGMLM
jgi:hypothetical protein